MTRFFWLSDSSHRICPSLILPQPARQPLCQFCHETSPVTRHRKSASVASLFFLLYSAIVVLTQKLAISHRLLVIRQAISEAGCFVSDTVRRRHRSCVRRYPRPRACSPLHPYLLLRQCTRAEILNTRTRKRVASAHLDFLVREGGADLLDRDARVKGRRRSEIPLSSFPLTVSR